MPSTTTTNAPGTFGANRASPKRMARLVSADDGRGPVPVADARHDVPELLDGVPRRLRRAEELVELPDRDVEPEADDEAVEHRAGEEAGDEAEAQQPEHDVEHPDEQRERSGQRDEVRRSRGGEWRDRCRRQRRDRRARPVEEPFRRAEDRVPDDRQRHGVEPVLHRHPGDARVRHRLRDDERPDHEARDGVPRQPAPLVARDPARDREVPSAVECAPPSATDRPSVECRPRSSAVLGQWQSPCWDDFSDGTRRQDRAAWNSLPTPCCSSRRDPHATGTPPDTSWSTRPSGRSSTSGRRGFGILSLFSQPTRLGDAIDRLEREHGALDRLRADAERRQHAHRGERAGHARRASGRRRAAGPTRSSTRACSTTNAGPATTWRPWPRRCAPTTSCSTSVPGAACSPSPRPEPAPGTSTRSRPATSPTVAERVFAANGVQDRVTLLPGWSRQLELPEPADSAGRRGHRQRAARGGDPRDHPRRPPPAAGTGRPPDPARAHAARAPGPAARGRDQAARVRARRGRAVARPVRHRLRAAARRARSRARPTRSPRARWSPPGRRSVRRSCSPRSTSTTFTEPSVHASADLVVDPPGRGERGRAHVPRRPARRHLAHARSVDVAGVELGDVGVGAARPARGRRGIRPARALPPPRSRRAGRAHVRGRRRRPSTSTSMSGSPMWMMPATRHPYRPRQPALDAGRTADGARHRGDRRQPWEWCVDGPAAGR